MEPGLRLPPRFDKTAEESCVCVLTNPQREIYNLISRKCADAQDGLEEEI